MLTFHLNPNDRRVAFDHPWEKCVGSCHAYTALREDYRRQLKRAHRDIGFEYVRFHGLLNDDMSVVLKKKDGTLAYNFFNIDCIFDFLLENGMKPFIELGFMPEALASEQVYCFHYRGNISKPSDYAQWDDLIRSLTAHLLQRYGEKEIAQWYFEVWNEPNLKFFYAGTQDDYFELYDHTTRSIKSVCASARVGGPATAINAWIPELIGYCRKNNVPLDFVSTHHYPTDDPLWNSGMSLEAFFAEVMKKTPEEQRHAQDYKRGVLTAMLKVTAEQAGDYPLHYTEWNTSASLGDERHDLPYSAAMICKTLSDNAGLVKTYSFWTFTDIFEEGGQLAGEFHGGFGLQTVHGVAKPTYRLMQLMHGMGYERYQPQPEQGSVGMIAAPCEGGMRVMLYNHDVLDTPLDDQLVCLKLDGAKLKRAVIARIDERHANAYACYQQMGAPVYPDHNQLCALNEASALAWEEQPFTDEGLQINLPAHGVAALDLKFC